MDIMSSIYSVHIGAQQTSLTRFNEFCLFVQWMIVKYDFHEAVLSRRITLDISNIPHRTHRRAPASQSSSCMQSSYQAMFVQILIAVRLEGL